MNFLDRSRNMLEIFKPTHVFHMFSLEKFGRYLEDLEKISIRNIEKKCYHIFARFYNFPWVKTMMKFSGLWRKWINVSSLFLSISSKCYPKNTLSKIWMNLFQFPQIYPNFLSGNIDASPLWVLFGGSPTGDQVPSFWSDGHSVNKNIHKESISASKNLIFCIPNNK